MTGLTVVAFPSLPLDLVGPPTKTASSGTNRGLCPANAAPAGDAKALPPLADKRVFPRFSFRHDPTQETLAVLFGFSPGPACQWIPRLTPIVNQAVGYHLQLPARQPAELHAVRAACPGLEFLIEGAERPIRRPGRADGALTTPVARRSGTPRRTS